MANILIDTKTTNAAGLAAFTGLAPGTYTYVENAAPNGYTTDTTEYTIVVTGAAPISESKTNSPTESGSITITKHVAGNPALHLAGATFKLMDSTGKTMQAVTAASDANGQIALSNLMSITGTPQTYELLEVTPPANYDLNTTQYNPVVTVGASTPEAIPNTPTAAGSLNITLTDTNYTQYGLTGVDYNLYWVDPQP